MPKPITISVSLLQRLGRLEEATNFCVKHCGSSLIIRVPRTIWGVVLTEQRKFDAAIELFQQAIAAEPDFGEPYNNMGVALMHRGQLDAALEWVERALAMQPDAAEAHKNRAVIWLFQGDFARGWPEYEWRWKSKDFPKNPYPQPDWDGQPLAGTLLLHAEQGLGDAIQFVRFAAPASQRAGRTILVCPPPLVPLLRRYGPALEVLPQRADLPQIDVQASLMSLPALLAMSLDDPAARPPYLQPVAEFVDLWRRELAGYAGFKVGIVWQGNPDYRGDQFRSMPLTEFLPLAEVTGATFFSLQKGFGNEQVREVADRLPIIDLAPRLDNNAGPFMDTAAVMANLDLIITTDTAAAHLAGAIGAPVWVALAQVPESGRLVALSTRRQPLVSLHATIPPAGAGRLVQCVRADGGRVEKRAADKPAGCAMIDVAQALAHAFSRHQAGFPAEAEPIYRQILTVEPKNAAVWHLLGVSAHQQGRQVEAIESISRAIRLDPRPPSYHNHLGAAYGAAQRYDEAVASFRRAINLDSRDPEIRCNLAVALIGLGNVEEAVSEYRVVQVRRNPLFLPAQKSNSPICIANSGDFASAEKGYEKVLASNPVDLQARLGLGILYERRGQLPQAAEHFRTAATAHPQHAESHFRLGCVLQTQGNAAQAAEAFDRALRIDRNHADAWNNLGCVLIALDRHVQAENALRNAVALRPTFAEAHNNLGTAAFRHELQYDQAMDCYRQAALLRPDFCRGLQQSHDCRGCANSNGRRKLPNPSSTRSTCAPILPTRT